MAVFNVPIRPGLSLVSVIKHLPLFFHVKTSLNPYSGIRTGIRICNLLIGHYTRGILTPLGWFIRLSQ
jgi:hypothetical protein